jgi:hypothetical protein
MGSQSEWHMYQREDAKCMAKKAVEERRVLAPELLQWYNSATSDSFIYRWDWNNVSSGVTHGILGRHAGWSRHPATQIDVWARKTTGSLTLPPTGYCTRRLLCTYPGVPHTFQLFIRALLGT